MLVSFKGCEVEVFQIRGRVLWGGGLESVASRSQSQEVQIPETGPASPPTHYEGPYISFEGARTVLVQVSMSFVVCTGRGSCRFSVVLSTSPWTFSRLGPYSPFQVSCQGRSTPSLETRSYKLQVGTMNIESGKSVRICWLIHIMGLSKHRWLQFGPQYPVILLVGIPLYL